MKFHLSAAQGGGRGEQTLWINRRLKEALVRKSKDKRYPARRDRYNRYIRYISPDFPGKWTGSEITDHAGKTVYFLSSLPLHKRPSGAARWALSNIPPSLMEVFKPLFLRADGAADGVAHSSVYPSSHCPCKSRQPETPLTPHHRPLPLYLSLLYEKPKGDPSLKINRFRSLSALLPFRCLSPWCSSFCRPGHDFRWNPQSRQSASKADPPSRALERGCRQEMWSGCFCF